MDMAPLRRGIPRRKATSHSNEVMLRRVQALPGVCSPPLPRSAAEREFRRPQNHHLRQAPSDGDLHRWTTVARRRITSTRCEFLSAKAAISRMTISLLDSACRHRQRIDGAHHLAQGVIPPGSGSNLRDRTKLKNSPGPPLLVVVTLNSSSTAPERCSSMVTSRRSNLAIGPSWPAQRRLRHSSVARSKA